MLLWLTLSIRCNAQVVAELVYQYPPPTWVENLAVRPNGWIIPVRASSPILTQLNPATGEIQALHDWSAVASSIMGITVVKPDVFMASTMYCDLLALQVRNPLLAMPLANCAVYQPACHFLYFQHSARLNVSS